MPVHPPGLAELGEIATSFGLTLSDHDLASFRALMLPTLASYTEVERMAEPALLPVRYPRAPGYRPGPEENAYDAWYWRTRSRGRPGVPWRANGWPSRTTCAWPACP